MSAITEWCSTPSRPVTIHSERSRYDGYRGHLVERDEEGGFEVELPGAERLVHFEASEVEFTAAVAR